MNGYYELVVKILKSHGFSLLRQTGGSHQVWSNGKRNVTVSTNYYSRHTANAIMRQAGIQHRF
ncbi:type II toxin-antitoxin system HicA family toxin [Roseateles sp.]|uniref:type II toxin-antitoxin system HicA family toxin n=1 Tax=Roseateles sp. TaxID=1971397 RepID=UPI003BA4037E